MIKQKFNIIFWNIWFKSQTESDRYVQLTDRFKKLIREHDPEAFGLNEVLIDKDTKKSKILSWFRDQGYQTYFTEYSQIDSQHVIGTALVCKKKPKKINYPVLGIDNPARRRGYKNKTITIIEADYPVNDKKNIKIVVNYMAHIVPYNWSAHLQHQKQLKKLLTSDFRDNSIIGGDYNEFKWMLPMWGATKNHSRFTGNILNPTWVWHGHNWMPLRANYDDILVSKSSSIEVVDFKVLGRTPSDHSPIIGTFTF